MKNLLMVCPYFYCNITFSAIKSLKLAFNAKQFHDFYPEGGGLENYAYNIAKGLVKKGFMVTVLCSTKKGRNKEETIDGVRVIMQKPDFIVSNTSVIVELMACG